MIIYQISNIDVRLIKSWDTLYIYLFIIHIQLTNYSSNMSEKEVYTNILKTISEIFFFICVLMGWEMRVCTSRVTIFLSSPFFLYRTQYV